MCIIYTLSNFLQTSYNTTYKLIKFQNITQQAAEGGVLTREEYLGVVQHWLSHLQLDILVSQQLSVVLGVAGDPVAPDVRVGVLFLGPDWVVYLRDIFLVSFPLDQLLILYPGDLLLPLSVEDRILEDCLLVDLVSLLLLLSHQLPGPLYLHLPVVGSDGGRLQSEQW